MTQFWSVLVAALVEFISSKFPVSFGDFFKSIFTKPAEQLPDPDFLVVGAAPADLKAGLRAAIAALVTSALKSKPVIMKLAISIIAGIPDAWYDSLWDTLIAKLPALMSGLPTKITTGESGDFPVMTTRIDEQDLAMAKVEAGID